ncbi:MAG: hypothetical protein ACT4N2_14340 [Hyphomicrobium sp.]
MAQRVESDFLDMAQTEMTAASHALAFVLIVIQNRLVGGFDGLPIGLATGHGWPVKGELWLKRPRPR